eukprot:13118724-Alexandrium_andersonii.AAC.1
MTNLFYLLCLRAGRSERMRALPNCRCSGLDLIPKSWLVGNVLDVQEQSTSRSGRAAVKAYHPRPITALSCFSMF